MPTRRVSAVAGAAARAARAAAAKEPGHLECSESVRVNAARHGRGDGRGASLCRLTRRRAPSGGLRRRRHSRQEAAHGARARRAAGAGGSGGRWCGWRLVAVAAAVLLVLLFRWVDPPITYLMAREWWRLGGDRARLGAARGDVRRTCRWRRRRRRTRTSAGTPGSISTASARRWRTTGGCAAGPRSASRWRRTSSSGRSGRGCARGWRPGFTVLIELALAEAADHGGLPQRRGDGRGRLRRRGRRARATGASPPPSSGRSAPPG